MEEETQPCPTCETPLDDLGLCPRCLLAAAMETTAAEQPASTAPALDEISASFPDLEILELIGKGGMGAVYKCRQKSLDRFVALKILPQTLAADESFALRFQAEAKALAALNHPNIVTIHDFGHQGDFYFLLMEFVDGLNLRHLIRDRKLSPEEALAIIPPLCEALEFAHERKIVHRDIKPENLLLDSSGRIKIADFGIATIIGQTELAGEKATGTPAYMAPEQRTNATPVDARADIYSLGVVLYEMLTGERPDAALTPPSQKTTLDVRIDEVVLRALSEQPDQRWQSATEFNTRLQTISTAPAAAHSVKKTYPHSSPKKAHRACLFGIISLLFLGLAPFLENLIMPEKTERATRISELESELREVRVTLRDSQTLMPEERVRLDGKATEMRSELDSLTVPLTTAERHAPFFLTLLSIGLALIAAVIGLFLGWRHLSWLRGQQDEKPAQLAGMFAALLWPVLVSFVLVFLVMCLPFNFRGWHYTSFLLGLVGGISYPVWLIIRTRAWMRNEPFFKNSRLLIVPLVTLVVLYGATILHALSQVDHFGENEPSSRDRDLQFLEEKLKTLYQDRVDRLTRGLGPSHPDVQSTYAQITAYEDEYQDLGAQTLYELETRILRQMIAEQEAQLAALRAQGLGVKHPDRVKIKQQINALENFLKEIKPPHNTRTDE